MPDKTAIREELQRVLASDILRSADSLRRLLGYLGEASLDGRAGGLKEYTVGVEALGKSPGYDPQSDSSVRVQAAKLRLKLDQYYRTEGAWNPVRIDFPKGHFELAFRNQEPRRGVSRQLRIWQGVALALALVTALAAWAAFSGHGIPRDSNALWTPEMQALWAPLVQGDSPILISFETGLFLETDGWTLRRSEMIETPEDAASSPALKSLLAKMGNPKPRIVYPYVGFGGLHGVFLLSNLLRDRKPALNLKRSVVLSWEDIRDNHLVFVGSGKTQVKVRDLLSQGEFAWQGQTIRNLKPKAREQTEYPETFLPSHERVEQYTVISMLPGPRDGRRVFVLGGGSSEADWAAAEYVTAPDHVKELVGKLRDASGRLPQAFQAVIRMRFRTGVPVEVSYVTHHVLK